MDEPTRSFWWQIWGRPVRSFALFMVFALLSFFVAGFIDSHSAHHEDFRLACVMVLSFAVFILAFTGLILSAIPRTRSWMSWIWRRWFFCGAVLATLIALFYAVENWRGQRAYERSKQALQAKGVVLDWDKFIPPPVPDDQNVFKAPKMQEWFAKTDSEVKNGLRKIPSNELIDLLHSQTNFPIWGESKTIDTEAGARAYLAWSDGLQPQFSLIREALKRPYSRMNGDYSNMLTLPFPNVVAVRAVARVMAQRIHCRLLLHEPEKALEDVTLIHDLSHFLDSAPSGKPITLVAAMMNVADVGLYTDVIGKGLQTHAWQEAQLTELQRQLSDIHTITPMMTAFASEPAASARALEMVPTKDIVNAFGKEAVLYRIAPRGWVYQNFAFEAPFFYAPTEALDITHEIVSPSACKKYRDHLNELVSHKSPYTLFAVITIPNLYKAVQTTARNQNQVELALTACAVERYYLANGLYPDSLRDLTPKFIEKLPHDIIDGGQLQYRRDGKSFLLYSIGWNEKDDGGMAALTPDNKPDPENGDWVWQYAAK
jgi:hypothetical protein